MSERSARKALKTKGKKQIKVACPLSKAEKEAVENDAYGQDLDVAKWLRRLIRRELKLEPAK